jgi:Rps23 Pro-64 3,4-dihydroxylase Tpa1-like proline 4-hydroxylase
MIYLEGFLEPEQNRKILDWAMKHKRYFLTSSVTTKEDGYRRSKIAYRFPQELILQKIDQIIEPVKKHFKHEFKNYSVECQMTAHNHGDFFKPHTDNGHYCTNRLISYVYYFYKQPKPFDGGQLVLYNQKGSLTVEPINNSLIFFASSCLHEVLPVHCPGENFSNSRFTINGWISELKFS